jgi:hypothetical protein
MHILTVFFGDRPLLWDSIVKENELRCEMSEMRSELK